LTATHKRRFLTSKHSEWYLQSQENLTTDVTNTNAYQTTTILSLVTSRDVIFMSYDCLIISVIKMPSKYVNIKMLFVYPTSCGLLFIFVGIATAYVRMRLSLRFLLLK